MLCTRRRLSWAQKMKALLALGATEKAITVIFVTQMATNRAPPILDKSDGIIG